MLIKARLLHDWKAYLAEVEEHEPEECQLTDRQRLYDFYLYMSQTSEVQDYANHDNWLTIDFDKPLLNDPER